RLACPVEIARGFFPTAAAQDVGAVTGQAAFQRDVRRRVDEAHRVFIHGVDAYEIRPDAAGRCRDLRRQFLARAGRRDLFERLDCRAVLGLGAAEHALAAETEHDVLGRHLIAIVKLHARTQFQFDGLVVDAAPFGGEAGNGFQAATPVLSDQRLPQRGEEHALPDVGLFAQYIERVRVGDLLHRDRDRRPVVGLSDRQAWQQQRAGCGVAEADDRTAGGAYHGLLLLRQSERIFRARDPGLMAAGPNGCNAPRPRGPSRQTTRP